MPFIDITIVPVRNEQKAAYLDFSRRMIEVYLDHGAVRVTDCWQAAGASAGEDFHAADAMASYSAGALPDMRSFARAGEGETVVVSITEWESREARDRGVKAVTADPRVQATVTEEPVFDGGRVIAAGFDVELTRP